MAPATSSVFLEYAARVRPRIEEALEQIARYPSGCPERLAAAIRHSLLAPGKRLRPLLVLMSCEACGCDQEKALPAACGVEMIHTYSLIHDDLPAMDDDDLRRGRPTCHAAFDEATAILAGDALLAQAFEVVAQSELPDNITTQMCLELARAAGPCHLVGGQADDLSPPAEAGEEALRAIHARKTGALFKTSLRLGGLAAEATPQQLQAMTSYGTQLGLAFQITDDLLDWEGDDETVGKRVGKDSQHGKLTFPGLLGVEASRREAAQLIAGSIDALHGFGRAAAPLAALAQYILERDR